MEQNVSTTAVPDTSNEVTNPQIIFAWKAPLRPYKKRSKNVLRFYIALALLLSVIVYFFGDKILLVPIWSLLFLFYVLTITPPPEVENKISRFGIETAGITLRWEVLSHFYFTNRFNYEILTVVTHGPYYLHSYMVMPDEETKKQVIRILSEHILYQEKPQRTITDKMIDLLSKLIPDDEDTAKEQKKETQSATSSPGPSSFAQTQIPASLLRQVSDPNE